MSSGQAYQIPTQQSSAFATGYVAGESSSGPTVQYVCGECNTKVSLARGDVIRCSMCGHRVLYKERTKRYVLIYAM
ncbi:DNA-directed RNA polymerase I, II, and III subunit RPABC4, partial [Cladophialophora psammophila CBS 110553]